MREFLHHVPSHLDFNCKLFLSSFLLRPTSAQKVQLWADLKSGAESGWDFTSRWYIDSSGQNSGTLVETRTSQILPTDLNALLCRCERNLASFHRILGERALSSSSGLGSARTVLVVA